MERLPTLTSDFPISAQPKEGTTGKTALYQRHILENLLPTRIPRCGIARMHHWSCRLPHGTNKTRLATVRFPAFVTENRFSATDPIPADVERI